MLCYNSKEVIKIKLIYTVTQEDLNLKSILRNKLKISNRLLIKLKMNHMIFVNDIPVSINYELKENDIIEARIDFIENDDIIPEKMNLDILYEDEYLLAINKAPSIVVHPSSYHPNGTIANGVKYYLNNRRKIRPINRLDRDTSGVVMFAKNEYIQEQFVNLKVDKEYIAIVKGTPTTLADTINAKISRKEGSIMERCVSEAGQVAITHYKVREEYENYSILSVKIETGRTHQIRVHMAHIGHPILGDTLYGEESKLINRQALHSYKTSFVHPITGEEITVCADVPTDMSKFMCVSKFPKETFPLTEKGELPPA